MAHGVLLIHGFTATPECMESLAIPLRKKGFLVEAPLLAGHGTTAEDLANTSWGDWYQSVADAFQSLKKDCESVCVAGLSLGGLLSLMLATEYPVRRLALLATPVFFRGFLTRVALPVVGRTPLRYFYPYQSKWAGPAINDPEAKAAFKSYTKMPLKSILQIVRLQKIVRPKLSSIQIPTLIVHSPGDTTVPYENMGFLSKNLGSRKIKTVTLKKSDHVLTLDYEKDVVAKEVCNFFTA